MSLWNSALFCANTELPSPGNQKKGEAVKILSVYLRTHVRSTLNPRFFFHQQGGFLFCSRCEPAGSHMEHRSRLARPSGLSYTPTFFFH